VVKPHRVIFNADDFGLTEGVCLGIIEAIRFGCVTGTTAMAAVPGAPERLLRWAPEIPGCVGAHLQLTSGRPVLNTELVPSLVEAGGIFPASKKGLPRAVPEEIVREWHAQVRVLQGLGIDITHIDTHHQVHRFPNVFAAFLEIAKHYKVPARSLHADMARELRAAGVPCVERTLLDWYGGDLSVSRLLRILNDAVPDDGLPCTLELMCHPGRVDGSLPLVSKYVDDREGELRVLTDRETKGRLQAAGFSLAGFAALSAAVSS
jgi:predicted glycoside hydrolase/deacetylase ChbG (UPF0249 family)